MTATTTTTLKSNIGLVIKTTTLHVHHAFLYISMPSLHDYYVKWPNLKAFWGRERQGDKLYHLCVNSVAAPLFSSNVKSLLLNTWRLQRGFHGRRCCQILMSLIPVTAWYRDSTHPIRSLILPFSGTEGGGGLGDECGLFSQTVAGNRAWMNPTLQGLMSSWKGAGSKPHPQGRRTMSFVPQPARFSLLLFHRLTYHPSLHNPANSEKWKFIQIESFKKD